MGGFLVPKEDVLGDELILRGAEAHHLVRVRRLRVGDSAEVTDGEGRIFSIVVADSSDDRVTCRIVSTRVETSTAPVRLCLAPALIKGARFDQVIEKATELGVDTIAPVLTARGVVPAAAERMDRWARVARAAAKQCGRSRLPHLAPPARLADLLLRVGAEWDRGLMAVPGDRHSGLREVLAADSPSSVLLLIGPEGGFTPDEEDRAAAAGVRRFSWGWTTLRAETACLVLAALVLHEADYARRPVAG